MNAEAPRPGPAAPAPEEGGRGLPLMQYWFVIVRRRWMILLAVVLALGGATFTTLRQPKIYQAAATIILEESAPRVVDKVQDVNETVGDSEKFYNTQMRIIQSHAVATRVAAALALDRDAAMNGGARGADALENAAGAVQGCLAAAADKHSHVVTVSCTSAHPELAARIANAAIQGYIDESQATRSSTSVDAIRFLGGQADDLRLKLERAERDLFEFNKRNDLLATSFEESQRFLSSNLFRLNEELSRVRTEGITQRAQLDEARKARTAGDPAVAAALLGSGQLLGDLKHRRAELQKELMALRARYKDGHPKIIENEAALGSLDRNFTREIDQIYGGLEIKVRANESQDGKLVKAIDAEMKRSLKLREKEVDYNRLKREVEHQKDVYALVVRRLKETELTRPLQVTNVRRLEPATPPGGPIKPDLRRNLMMALAIGLFAGLGLAFALEFLDDTVRSPEDVEQTVGLPLLGIVPTIEPCRGQPTDAIERARAEYVAHHPMSQVAESCHTVATNVYSLFLKTPPRVIMIASASPQEGKTLFALQLAASVGARGRRVLVVDADLRRGRLHRVLGGARTGGVYEVLANEQPVAEVVRESGSPNVAILTTGAVPEKMNPLRLLELPDFTRLAAQLREAYDLVIFDSAPIGLVADAIHIGAVCDGAVVVARYRHASRRGLRAAVQQLETGQVRVVGCVINDLDPRSPQYGFYRSYGYGYRPGYESGYAREEGRE
ncbi:MAG TPA: polysaccharide biosynthesis tyrosine autokinase [Polyangia bacterium]|jgi:capsular exopolysaccharide synthesis family protein